MAESLNLALASISELSRALAAGETTSEQLVLGYLDRIVRYDRQGPKLNSVLEVNPDALFIAQAMDRERMLSGPRGPLHGIPVLIKDNIDTADKMHTSAGSLALADSFAPRDAFVTSQLRKAGAIILGKTNMTEFANFLTTNMPAGYSSRGGQVLNPYLPGQHTPSGSSAGSGAAPAAGLCAAAIGTETSGSILSPANNNSLVGIKPTVGLVSRTGIIPIAFSQDTAGPMARTVADAALLLGALTGVDESDPATWSSEGRAHRDYAQFLDKDGLKGARIGIPRRFFYERVGEEERLLYEAAIGVLRDLGAEVVDPADIATVKDGFWQSNVLTYEFKPALNSYLAALGPHAPVRTMADIIAFNYARPEATLKYGQVLMAAAQRTSGTLTEPEYLLDRLKDLRLAQIEGIDATMAAHQLDSLFFPASAGAWIGARPGYPSVIVPAGYTSENKPFGVTFLGRAWEEPCLIRYAYAYEQAALQRRPPNLE